MWKLQELRRGMFTHLMEDAAIPETLGLCWCDHFDDFLGRSEVST